MEYLKSLNIDFIKNFDIQELLKREYAETAKKEQQIFFYLN